VDSWFSLSGDRPNVSAAQVLRSLAEVLHERAYEMSSLDGPGEANSRVALDAVTPHVAYVRDMRMVRVLADQLGDQGLTERALATVADDYAARQRADGVWVQAAAWLVTASRS
jgi:hypothetical protein